MGAAPLPAALLTTADAYLAQLIEKADDDDATKAAKTALRAQFVAAEPPADFATHLADDPAAITAADADQEGEREDYVASTAAVGRLIRDGMKEVTSSTAWYIANARATRTNSAPGKAPAISSAPPSARPNLRPRPRQPRRPGRL